MISGIPGDGTKRGVVISSVAINNLRGIREGVVKELTGLTVLVGSNGSGKSTVLDALSIGVTRVPGEAVGDAVLRRASRHPTTRWLFANTSRRASVHVARDNGTRFTILDLKDQAWARALYQYARAPELERRMASGVSLTVLREVGSPKLAEASIAFFADGEFDALPTSVENPGGFQQLSSDVRFVDMRFGARSAALNKLLTDAKSSGRYEFAFELAREVVPGLTQIEILPLDDAAENFDLFTTFRDRSVPLAVAGDGVRGLIRLALELAAHPGGLALVEEPEVHLHPRALRQTARALVAASKRGVQLVLATHSLELIDLLAEYASAEQLLPQFSVQRLVLDAGTLQCRLIPGEQVSRVRQELELELR